ncbi:acetyl-CoA C-acetyltransferase [Craterilacuibacter sinensis]|uniref:Acetyl-CoA C-acetyltransferase n=1 Tax=Craterilacuibacter sinensis TaxID=2686017 RepID=A0A845BY67_9NEIS|nr:acetyl-CoA C-acetyltransferase [Craterilacuibacter sinensis]MXR37453.1 acetyl-CoA C-acetyltransferase [Craterilacuibacter sinensis]
MAQAYIVDALRSPTGKRKGSLSDVHAADLGAHVIRAIVARNAIPAEDYDDVVFGCVDTIGSQAGDIARTSWLAAGMPLAVPGTTIDRQCGSSQQAVHFAAQAVMSGTMDVVLAGGVQTMTRIPISAAMLAGQAYGYSTPFAESRGWQARFGAAPVNQFYAAQRIADHWGLSRAAMEAFALESHAKARHATEEGHFAREIVALNGLDFDETVRETSLAKMAELEPVDAAYPGITAAVSSQTADASAAVLVVSEAALKRYGLTPRARIHHLSVRGDDPIWHLRAPIPATEYALKRCGMKLSDIDLVEINEAFASVVMAWQIETGFDPARINVNGGAIALGHPLGASGARLMTTLLHELERTGGRFGLQTMCEGGGQANVTIIERL